MTPDISEFSYGFALTHELANRAGGVLSAAPIFPSLFEEGRAGGGYDVALDAHGALLFLQFKRADCMMRSSAKQIKEGLALGLPYYRFSITERLRSDQHELLLALDAYPNEVFYAAPRFHRVAQLNEAYLARAVQDRSIFIRPRDIGRLDDASHCVAFDDISHFICSEPRVLQVMDGQRLWTDMSESLVVDETSIRAKLTKSINLMQDIVREASLLHFEFDGSGPDETSDKELLRQAADLALRYFSTQLLVIQPIAVFSREGG
jgi:hypothetical protein